jgi:hypothetical protein
MTSRTAQMVRSVGVLAVLIAVLLLGSLVRSGVASAVARHGHRTVVHRKHHRKSRHHRRAHHKRRGHRRAGKTHHQSAHPQSRHDARRRSDPEACAASRAQELAEMAIRQSACWKPFSANSPFNTPLLPRPQLISRSAIIRAHMEQYHWTVQGSSSQSRTGFTLAAQEGTRPLYFASPHDPLVTVRCWERYGPSSCPERHGQPLLLMRLHIPGGARPADNSDAHMSIIETATGNEYDFYDTSVSRDGFEAGVASISNATTAEGINQDVSAAGFALSAGLLRPSELASGYIGHALVMSIPCVSAQGPSVGFAWPADGGWGQQCGDYWDESAATAPAIGQLFKLNMTGDQIARTGAPAWEQEIMTALSHFGAYAEDTNGSAYRNETMQILTQDESSWTNLHERNQWAAVIHQFGGRDGMLASAVPIPVSRLEVVAPCAVRWTCQ